MVADVEPGVGHHHGPGQGGQRRLAVQRIGRAHDQAGVDSLLAGTPGIERGAAIGRMLMVRDEDAHAAAHPW